MSDQLKFEVNISTLATFWHEIKRFVRPRKRYLITIKEWEARSLPANAQVHIWIKQIGEYTGEDIKTTEARCKRDHGLAIALSGENGAMLSWMLDKLRFDNLTDDQQLKIISAMEITRNFTTKEHNAYRNSIQHYWNNQGLQIGYIN